MFYVWLVGALVYTLVIHQIALRCLKRIADPSDRLAAATICTVIFTGGLAGFLNTGFTSFSWRSLGLYTMLTLVWQVVGHLRLERNKAPEVSNLPPVAAESHGTAQEGENG